MSIAAQYPSRERFLTEVTLDPPAATSDDAAAPGRDDDYLVLLGMPWRYLEHPMAHA